MNGGPLFTGGAGSGPSNIRRWLIENDMLEAIVGLPDQMFYNTGIYTFIWVLTNVKTVERQGQVQLIDARGMSSKMKSLGNKRNMLADDRLAEITNIYESFTESEVSKIVANEEFGFRKVAVDRPLRVRWNLSRDTIGSIAELTPVKKLDVEVREKLLSSLEGAIGTGAPTEAAFNAALKPFLDGVGVTTPVVTT